MAHLSAAENEYLKTLIKEKERIDPTCVNSIKLIAKEIDRIQSGTGKEKMLVIHQDKADTLSAKIQIPVKEYPKINFPGRIIGAKGAEMKAFQDRTGVKLFVFGRGSMSDRMKEEELRKQGGRYEHLNEDMHVKLEVLAQPIEAFRRMSMALNELRPYLLPDAVTNGAGVPVARGVGPGATNPQMMAPGMRPPRGPDPWMGSGQPRPNYQAPAGRGVGGPPAGFDNAGARMQRPAMNQGYQQYGGAVDQGNVGPDYGWGPSGGGAPVGGGKQYQPSMIGQHRMHPYQDAGASAMGRGQRAFY